jgi:hypothetical protein
MEKHVGEEAERYARAHDCAARILGTAGAIGVGVIVWRVQLSQDVDPLVAASTAGAAAMVLLMMIWVSCESAVVKLVRACGGAPKLARWAQRLYPQLAYEAGLFAYKDRTAPWLVRVVMQADPLGVWSRPDGAVSMYYIEGGYGWLAPPQRHGSGDFPIRDHIAGSPHDYWLLNTFMTQTNMAPWALEQRALLDGIHVLDTAKDPEGVQTKSQIKEYVATSQKAMYQFRGNSPTLAESLHKLEAGMGVDEGAFTA